MFVKRFVFLFFFLVFSAFLTAQTQKELKEMSYDAIVDSFFVDESDFLKQLKYANVFHNRYKDDKDKASTGYELLSMAYSNNKDYERALYYSNLSVKSSIDLPKKYSLMNAYWSKAVILSNLKRYNEAINNYIKAEQISKKEYPNFRYAITLNIGILKSENLGETEEGLEIFKKCYNYYRKKSDIDTHDEFYRRTLFSLADAFNSLGQIDSATFYNRKGYKNADKYKDDLYLALFTLNEGASQIQRKNYNASIDSINIALPKLKKISNLEYNILAAYYYYGKAYEGMNNEKEAIINFNRVDSIYQKSNIITPEFTYGYRYLIDYYKKIGNKEKQLYYINALMQIDSTFQQNYKEMTKKLYQEYDIPHLLEEKQNIIKVLKEQKKENFYIICVLVFVVFVTMFFGVKQVQQRKKFKHLFDNLIATTSEVEILVPIDPNIKETKNTLDIASETVLDIRKKLKIFEKEKRYLNASISIQTLAQDFSTNTKYLSGIINYTFEKSFIHYINDLRIDQIVQELKINRNLRKYTITGIAEEAGFNTAESFSKAFFKRTGIKPSYFIKELGQIQSTDL